MPVTINGSGSVTGVSADSLSTGLQHITTKSFTGVSSVSVNNCFTATYDIYQTTISLTASANGLIRARFRTSGTDNTTTNYLTAGYRFTDGGAAAFYASGAAATEGVWLQVDTAYPPNFTAINIDSPFLAARTRWAGQGSGATTGVAGSGYYLTGGLFNGTTSFDGFTIYNDAGGTLTGTLRVYGYMNGVAS